MFDKVIFKIKKLDNLEFNINPVKTINNLLSIIKRKQSNNAYIEFIQYFFVGGFAAVIDISVFMFANLWVDYRIALIFSYTFGSITNFLLSNAIIFDRRNVSIIETFIKQYIAGTGGLLTNEIIMIVLVEIFLFNNLFVGKIVATGCVFIVNFLFVKHFAFNHKITINRLFKSKANLIKEDK